MTEGAQSQTSVRTAESAGRGWEGEGGSREGRVCQWLIHVDVCQQPAQYCKAIILQLKINIFFLKGVRKDPTQSKTLISPRCCDSSQYVHCSSPGRETRQPSKRRGRKPRDGRWGSHPSCSRRIEHIKTSVGTRQILTTQLTHTSQQKVQPSTPKLQTTHFFQHKKKCF